MASSTPRNRRTIWILTLSLLLTGIALPSVYHPGAPVGLAEAVETQSDPTACSAVGNNWTSCNEATASNDVFAEAENGWAERGSIDPLVTFQDTPQSTSSIFLQNANAETTALASGVPHLVIYSGNHGGSDTSAVSELVLEFGATVIGRGIAEGRGTNNHWDSGQTAGFSVVTGDGASTLRFRFRCVTGGDTCYAGSMAIVALPLDLLSPGEDYWYEVRNGDSWNVTNAPTFTWVDLLTATFNLPEDGNYLVLMSGEGATSPDEGNEGVRMRFLANGTILGSEYVQELEDSRDSYNFMKSQVETLSEGSHTFEIEVRSRGVSFADFRRGRIVVLRAAAFDQILQTSDTSGDTTTSTSFVDFTGLDTTFTPNLAEWVVVFANTVLGSSSQAATAQLRDETAGVSHRVNSGEVENDVGFDSGRDQQPTLIAHAEQGASTKTWKVRYRADPSGTAAIGRNAPNTAGIRSDLIVWGLALPGPGRNDTAWFNFGYGLDPEDEVGRVEVGVEWYRVTPEPILNVTVSWDGGLSWAANRTVTNKSADDDTLEWLDFTAATTWNPTKLLDAALRVRAGTNASGARIDYITVRVTYNDAPTGSNLRLLDTGGQSVAGELLDVGTPYRFLFAVRDEDGWADIGQDGRVSLRLWYDGGATPELTFAEQTNGSNYRIELRFEDLADAGNATLDEWSVIEGSASYGASNSSLTEIYNGPTLIGYEFDLTMRLGLKVKATPDPMDSTPGGYNDPDSWNVELEVYDGGITTVLRTVPSGEHLEFGVFARPLMAYVVTPTNMTIQPAQTTVFQVDLDNVGQGNAETVWVNVTLPAELTYLSDDAGSIGGVGSCCYSFEFTDVTPGSQTFRITVSANGGTPNGTMAVTNFTFESLDSQGRPVNQTARDVVVTIVNGDLSYSATPSSTFLGPGDPVVIRIDFNNSGDGEAASVWINVTLPSELIYESDDAASIGGSRTCCHNFLFTDVAPGAFSFNLTASAAGGAPNGTVATTNLTLETLDPAGALFQGPDLGVTVTLLNADLHLALTSSAAIVDPADLITLTITLTNRGSRDAENLLVQASVDVNATYRSSTPPGTYNGVTRTLTWNLPLLAAGAQTLLQWTVEVDAGAAGGVTVTSSAQVDYEDVSGTSFPTLRDSTQAVVRGPGFSPVLIVDRSTAERGDVVTATVFYNNTGTGPASVAWANWSLNGHYELVDLTPPVLFAPSASGFDVTLNDVDPGDHLLVARLRVIRGMMDGLLMDLQVGWKATNLNGTSNGDTTLEGAVTLSAPATSVSLFTSESRIEIDRVFALNVSIHNSGGAAAVGWLNLTPPPGVQYVTHTGSLAVTQSPELISWEVSSLPVGTTISFEILFVAPENPGVETLQLTLAYTDLRGSPAETVLSNQVFFEFIGSPGLLGGGFPWWLLLLIAAAGATMVFLLTRRYRSGPDIEEVFVVHQNGILIAHRSKTLTPDKDEDVLAAMLSTVQSFIQDAFNQHEDSPVRGLQFDKFNIMVEQGSHHYVAVVFRGADSGSLQERLHELSQRIEVEFGEILAEWQGDTIEVRPVKALLPLLWGKRKVRPTKPEEPAQRVEVTEEKPVDEVVDVPEETPRGVAEADTPEESGDDDGETPSGEASPEITMSAVRRARKAQLQAWCIQLGLDDSGKVADLRERLVEEVETRGEVSYGAEDRASLPEEVPGEDFETALDEGPEEPSLDGSQVSGKEDPKPSTEEPGAQATPTPTLTVKQIWDASKTELREWCQQLGLDDTGPLMNLRLRLLSCLESE